MKRTIRLTESEFHSLVRRLVIEAEEEMAREEMDIEGMDIEDMDTEDMDAEDISMEDAKEVAMDVIQDTVEEKTKNMSSEKIMSAIKDLQALQRKIQSSPELKNMSLEDVVDELEGGELSEDDDLESRKFRRNKNLKIGAGIGTSAAGLLSMMSQGKGYIDMGGTMISIHDALQNVAGEYVPLIGLGMIVAGIIYSLKAAAEEKQIKESYQRRNARRNYRR